MDRKGQVTIFIIFGAIIAILLVTFFYLRGVYVEREIEVPLEAQPLKLYVESCLESTAVNGIQLAGIQGGYTDIPDLALETDYSIIAYHYYNGDNTAPPVKTIESQISSFITRTLDVCLANFTAFKEQGYDITTGDISTKTMMFLLKLIIQYRLLNQIQG